MRSLVKIFTHISNFKGISKNESNGDDIEEEDDDDYITINDLILESKNAQIIKGIKLKIFKNNIFLNKK